MAPRFITRCVTALCAAALVVPAYAGVYKCVVNGQTVFSGTPCGSDANEIAVEHCNSPQCQRRREAAAAASRANFDAVNSSVDRQLEKEQQWQGSGVMEGMTAEDVRRRLGQPTKINRDVSGAGTHEQCVYRDSGADKYIYLDDGKVTYWQGRPNTRSESRPRTYSSPCAEYSRYDGRCLWKY